VVVAGAPYSTRSFFAATKPSPIRMARRSSFFMAGTLAAGA
jgi:hypothetical protein